MIMSTLKHIISPYEFEKIQEALWQKILDEYDEHVPEFDDGYRRFEDVGINDC